MKCLVAGGAGFIGSHIAEALIRRGDAVRVFDNLTTGKKEHLASVLDRIEFLEGDLRRAEDLARAVRGIEVGFHQAALRSAPRSGGDPASTNDFHITGSPQLRRACRAAGVKR